MANRKSELETLKADLEARLSRYQAHQRREAGALEKDFEEQASQTQNDEVVDLGAGDDVRQRHPNPPSTATHAAARRRSSP